MILSCLSKPAEAVAEGGEGDPSEVVKKNEETDDDKDVERTSDGVVEAQRFDVEVSASDAIDNGPGGQPFKDKKDMRDITAAEESNYKVSMLTAQLQMFCGKIVESMGSAIRSSLIHEAQVIRASCSKAPPISQ